MDVIAIAGLVGTIVAVLVGLSQLADFVQKQQEKKAPKLPPVAPAQPPAPVTVPAEPCANLPAEITPLIGRDQDVEKVCALLRRAEVRLVTLVGPPGAGKTRLGIKAASALIGEFQDGVFFVALAPVQDPAVVAPTVAHSLRLKEATDRPFSETLKHYLRDKQMLLVLDNFEHVMSNAALISELLAAAPGLKVLVTSREALSLSGEHEYTVSPLPLPDLEHLPAIDQLVQLPSVALFVQRSRAVTPSFQVTEENARSVAELCNALDGLPLAIELAAAWSKLLSPREMLSRLEGRFAWLTGGARDLPVHQQALQDTLKWSYDLLDAWEQALFQRLSVFVGGCTLEAAAAVCDGALQLKVLEGIASLVDKSLLQRQETSASEPRFTMLVTIREYAYEQLENAGELEAVCDLHLAYFLQLAKRADLELRGNEQLAWLRQLDLEYNNLRAALAWSMQNRPDIALRLVSALHRYWEVRTHLREGREWLAKALSQPGVAVERANALFAAGSLAWRQGDYTAARALYEQCIALRTEVGSHRAIAAAFVSLAGMLTDAGDHEKASTLLQDSSQISRSLRDKLGSAAALSGLGAVALNQGDYPLARNYYQEAIKIAREEGDHLIVTHMLRKIADIDWYQGDFSAARSCNQEALRIGRASGEIGLVTSSLTSLGYLSCDEGEYEVARALFDEALALRREVGDKRGEGITLNGLGDVASRQGNIAEAHAAYTKSLAIKQEIGDNLGIAITLNNLGRLASEQKDFALAYSLITESLQLYCDLRNKRGEALALRNLAKLSAMQGELDQATSLYKSSLEILWGLRAKREIAALFEGIAMLAVQQAQHERATRLLAAAENLRTSMGLPLPPAERPRYEESMTAAQQRMGEVRFAESWASGQAMALEQAVAGALSDSSLVNSS